MNEIEASQKASLEAWEGVAISMIYTRDLLLTLMSNIKQRFLKELAKHDEVLIAIKYSN